MKEWNTKDNQGLIEDRRHRAANLSLGLEKSWPDHLSGSGSNTGLCHGVDGATSTERPNPPAAWRVELPREALGQAHPSIAERRAMRAAAVSTTEILQPHRYPSGGPEILERRGFGRSVLAVVS